MKIKPNLLSALLTVVLLLTACNLPKPTPTPTLPPGPTITDTEPGPGGATPTLPGPAIAHLSASRGIDILSVHMLDPFSGWAIGGLNQTGDHVFRTADGGQTWIDVTPPEPAPPAGETASAIGAFHDASTAWVAYAGGDFPPPEYVYLWSTHDGGASWSYSAIQSSISPEAFRPWFIDFVDSTHGWLLVYLGAGMSHNYVILLSTSDSGQTWVSLVNPENAQDIQSCPKTGMVFYDAHNGWLTRQCGGLYDSPFIDRTTDGGSTWTQVGLPAPLSHPDLFSSHVCDPYSPNPFSAQAVTLALKCRNTSDYTSEQDFVYSTTDGGATWHIYDLPAQYTLGEGLSFPDPQTGFAFGRRIYRTSNGGQTWTFVQQVYWDGQFSFVSPSLGWAAVVSYDSNNNQQLALVNTIDGGATWGLLNPIVAP
jgi:photosystem II stability/assembly factor-like uncharacterized protein